jgi:HEAT repeat protein
MVPALMLVVCLTASSGATQTVRTGSPLGSPATVADRIAALAASDPVARAFAACELGLLRHDAAPALAALIQLLPDAAPIDPVFCGRDEFGPITMLTSRRSAPGLEAARALAAIGAAGVEPLLNAARGDEAGARRHAVHALTAVRDSRVAPLFVAVSTDPDPQVRRDAALGLGRFRDAAAVAALVRALEDTDATVREAAARSLGRAVRNR